MVEIELVSESRLRTLRELLKRKLKQYFRIIKNYNNYIIFARNKK